MRGASGYVESVCLTKSRVLHNLVEGPKSERSTVFQHGMDLLSQRSDFHALIGKREGFENLSGEYHLLLAMVHSYSVVFVL